MPQAASSSRSFVMRMPESTSISMRLGLSVWKYPASGAALRAHAVDTGSSISGTVQRVASVSSAPAERFASATQTSAPFSTGSSPSTYEGVRASFKICMSLMATSMSPSLSMMEM